MTNLIHAVADGITDHLDKFTGPVDRAGHAAQRAWVMDKAGTPHAAIAVILTDSSKRLGKNHVYTEAGIPTLINVYDDSLSGTLISAKVTRAIVSDQIATHGHDGDPLTV